MAEHAGEKSFEATPHRRQEAREKGQVVFSQDLGSAALLLLAALLLKMFGVGVMKYFSTTLIHQLGEVPALTVDRNALLQSCLQLAYPLALVVLPVLGLLMLGGLLSVVLQIGILWVPEKVSPDVSRLNPWSGLQRICSIQGVSRLGFGLIKVVLVAIVAGSVLWSRSDEMLRASALDVARIGQFLVNISHATLFWTGLTLLVLAIFDYALQRWKFEKDLRMTHQEVREEMKNLQGDPQVVARRRQIQRQIALNRISSGVPTADVIITNPTELAVAVQYDPQEMAAPVVIAKGAGVLAQRIRRLALEHNIPVVERKPLAQLLYKNVEIGKPIPADSYAAVAEVLAYVYQLTGKKLKSPPSAA